MEASVTSWKVSLLSTPGCAVAVAESITVTAATPGEVSVTVPVYSPALVGEKVTDSSLPSSASALVTVVSLNENTLLSSESVAVTSPRRSLPNTPSVSLVAFVKSVEKLSSVLSVIIVGVAASAIPLMLTVTLSAFVLLSVSVAVSIPAARGLKVIVTSAMAVPSVCVMLVWSMVKASEPLKDKVIPSCR